MNELYFITGHHAVGKTYLVNQLQQLNPAFVHFDTGPEVRAIYKNAKTVLSFKEWEKTNTMKYGDHFVDNLLCEKLKSLPLSDNDILLITGFRSLEGIAYTARQLNIGNPKIVYIDSIYPLMKENYEKRENKILTDKEFIKLLAEENKRGLNCIKKYVNNNTQTCKLLYNLDNKSLVDKFLDFTTEVIRGKNEKQINILNN